MPMDASPEPAPGAPPAARPRREPFAAGDGLTRYPPGSPDAPALRIDAPWEKPWQARLPGGATAAPFPGTAILFEGVLYEVVRAEALGGRFVYGLRPWEEASPPRQVVAYTVESCEQAAREREERLRRLRQGHALAWLSPLVGLLPAADQRRIERDYGVSATRATLISSLVFLGPSLAAFVLGLATLMSSRLELRHAAIPWDTLLPLSTYLLVESFARLGAAGYAGEPLGALLLALPVLAVRAVAEAIAASRKGRPRPPARDLLEQARDEVTALPDGRIEVLSLLPKPHWGPGTGIFLDGVGYRLESREEVAHEGRRGHRFRLAPEPEARLLRAVVEYRPEEVRELHRQALLFRKRTWVETFAPLWGLLDAGTQRRLAELYEFDAPRHTAWSALGVALLAGADLVLALGYLASRRGGLADLLVLLAAAYLFGESLLRLLRARSGEPAGSVLGRLLLPFARRLVV
jgi:hypothetical protein